MWSVLLMARVTLLEAQSKSFPYDEEMKEAISVL
jgi:hypothetical protein